MYMDASDLANKYKNQTLYTNKLNALVAKNPGGDCASLGSCCGTTTNCARSFTTFEQKYSFYMGRNASVTGGVPAGDFSFGVIGCITPVNGGSM
jgi:hypothetical protein